MTFEQYMNSKIPTWRTKLSIELINELKYIFDSAAKQEATANNIFDMAFKCNKSGIDYSTDFDKANEKLAAYNSQLINKVEEIKNALQTIKNM